MKSHMRTLATIVVILTTFLSVSVFTPVKVHAAGTVYYVDSVNGNDNNNGTSESTPWKTLSKVNSMTFQPGDQIKFKAGGSWTGQLLPKGSGSSGNPIVITKYGTGADPIIDGAGASYTMRLHNQQYWEIRNIEIMNTASTDALRIGLYITATDAGTLNHIYVQNVYFHDIRSKAPNYSPGSHESAGSFTGAIVGRIFGNTVPTRFNDVRIENCTFRNTDRNMFYFFDSPWYNDSELGMSGGAGAMFNSTNVVVRNNYAVDIPGTGTCLCSCDGAIVEYNILDNTQCNVPANVAGVACSTWSSQDCIYQYNEVMNTNGTADGQSFDNDGACRRCIFQYNYSHDNNGGFFLVCSLSSCKVFDSVCRYNISQNDRTGLFDHRAASYNTKIYNNTIYIKSGLTVPMFRPDTDSKKGTAAFYNNIFYNMGGSMGTGYNPYGNFTWSNNVFYGNFATTPNDANKITSDPMLVNPGSGGNGRTTVDGYKLKPNSPCINTGMIISNNGGKDYWGNPLYNGSPDRGAHEYEGTVQQPAFTKVDLSSYFNADGFSYDTKRNDGNYDDSGYTYSADLVNPAPVFENVEYQMGPFANGQNNVVNCSNQTIALTPDSYISIRILGSATAGDKTGTFRINYSDGTYTNVSVTMRDWCTGSSGQKIVQTMAHRHSQTSDSPQTNYIYAYYLTPASGKTVTSIRLPNNTHMHVLAISLVK
ncbi:MAG TPA: DUF5123 domain-containing protein [Clostridiaceae bacterium]|nr:DUF5123 domain-containing protein [Clostridiaceae bacterium]